MHDQLLYYNKHLLHDGWGNIKIYFAKKNYLSRVLRLQIICVYIVSSYHFHTIAVKKTRSFLDQLDDTYIE